MPARKSVSKRKRTAIPREVEAIAERFIGAYAKRRQRGHTFEGSLRRALNDVVEDAFGFRPIIDEDPPAQKPHIKAPRSKKGAKRPRPPWESCKTGEAMRDATDGEDDLDELKRKFDAMNK